MTNRKSVVLLLTLAFAATFASEIAAQFGGRGASRVNVKESVAEAPPRNLPSDMRLWSFGDCDNKFPIVNSDEHKECVRVVGSDEARDARAYRVCEISNPGDPEEVGRCKNTYKANRDRSAQSGYVPNSTPQQQAAPTAEELQRVRAIASAAVENDKAAETKAATGKPSAVESVRAPEEPGGPSPLVIVLGVVVAGGGAAAFFMRRREGSELPVR
jgi:hypothetical protein